MEWRRYITVDPGLTTRAGVALPFKVDENVARDPTTLLRERGHDVQTVEEEALAGGDDVTIAEACRVEIADLMRDTFEHGKSQNVMGP